MQHDDNPAPIFSSRLAWVGFAAYVVLILIVVLALVY